jgi:hypothetical protein
MPALDWFFVAVLLLSMLLGAWRGLVFELISLVGWLAALALAWLFAGDVAPFLPMRGASDSLRHVLAFLLVFVGTVMASALLAVVFKKLNYVWNRWRCQQCPVNQLIYDALLLLQHRGQDAAGIVTQQERKFFMHKAKGMVRDVFRTRNMRSLPGNCGLGQVRYPTAGNAFSEEEAQPFYVNAPFGIVLVHNGNLTNAQALKAELFNTDHRHINTESDSEVLLNVLAHEIERHHARLALAARDVFAAVRGCTSASRARTP